MPIAALPTKTIRAIGSTQALTDPASLVKELIDNAIDGRATTVSVELSANTLDDIRVKDNGHGISPEDRSMICTRYCTSKIRGLEDLHAMGGRSLGFRGEALASAAEMSGHFTLSTRVEGEETASELKFDRQGRIASEKRTTLPVGTTVRVEKFLEVLPVRRQTTENNCVKVLAKVKRLLQAYALVRPHLRFSLKILKAKNDKGNWKYPKNVGFGTSELKPSVFNAATEIIGKKVTDHCQWVSSSWASTGEQIDTASELLGASASLDGTYTFEAVLAKFEREGSLISHVGQYLSVDSRPVSCARGTLKQIVTIYKSYLKTKSEITKISDPFLRLDIACPQGTYDVNVEPAKDDVLFANPDFILQLAEKHFRSIYGELVPTITRTIARYSPSRISDIKLMLARKTPSNEDASMEILPPAKPAHQATPSGEQPTYQQHASLASSTSQGSITLAKPQPLGLNDQSLIPLGYPLNGPVDLPYAMGKGPSTMSESHDSISPQSSAKPSPRILQRKLTWRPSMYTDEEDDMAELDNALGQQNTPVMDEEIDEDTLRNAEVSNPWTLAKLNAAFRPPGKNRYTTERNDQLPTPGRQLGDAGTSTELSSDDFTQGPDPSSEASLSPNPFPFPLKTYGKRQGANTGVKPQASASHRCRNGALDTWVQRSLHNSADGPSTAADSGIIDSGIDPIHSQHQRNFVSARSLPIGTPPSAIPDAFQRPRRKFGSWKQQECALHKPFISPVNDPERVWFDTGENSHKRQSVQTHPRQEYPYAPTAPALNLRDNEAGEPAISTFHERTMHPDLAFTLDYEARKQKAMDQHREALRQQAAAEKREARALAERSANKTPANSPHKNRQAKAIAALHTNADTLTNGDSFAFETGDPRAYLLRVQQSGQEAGVQASKSKRRKTMMLPFETLREDAYIGDLVLPLKTEHPNFEQKVLSGCANDEYISRGEEAVAFSEPTAEQIGEWEMKLKEMMKAMYRIEGMAPEEEMGGELDVDLGLTLQAHAAATADLTVS